MGISAPILPASSCADFEGQTHFRKCSACGKPKPIAEYTGRARVTCLRCITMKRKQHGARQVRKSQQRETLEEQTKSMQTIVADQLLTRLQTTPSDADAIDQLLTLLPSQSCQQAAQPKPPRSPLTQPPSKRPRSASASAHSYTDQLSNSTLAYGRPYAPLTSIDSATSWPVKTEPPIKTGPPTTGHQQPKVAVQAYACMFCSRRKSSNDPTVLRFNGWMQIVCECGGHSQDGESRAHSAWFPIAQDCSHLLNTASKGVSPFRAEAMLSSVLERPVESVRDATITPTAPDRSLLDLPIDLDMIDVPFLASECDSSASSGFSFGDGMKHEPIEEINCRPTNNCIQTHMHSPGQLIY